MGLVNSHFVNICKKTISGLPIASQMVDCREMAVSEFPYQEIGARLDQLRVGFSELNQKDWAEKHGFNPTQYNNWIKGKRRIPVDASERLCDTYGLTLDFIYRGRIDGLAETARNVALSARPKA